jgi:trk system potassium uptake protein TrkH
VGASAGSTGGGIKMIRTLILLRQTGRELARMVHPRAVAPLTLGGRTIENPVIFSVLGFMLLWGATQLVVGFVLLVTGFDFTSAFSVAVALVNNLGPALGAFGPAGNYAALDGFQSWLLALAMLAGRLELLTFFVVLTPAFWRR